MRPRIVDLRVDEIAWKPLGPAGLYSRLLSRDEETGARTALQRIVPGDGYVPPQTAHYHHTYEEIIGITGCFSFDSRRWVKPCTYVFHPPRTVHGFASAVREESMFLSRVGRDLDFNFVEEPEHDDLYTVEGPEPLRSAQALDDHEALADMVPASFLGGDVLAHVLSVDPESGEGSALVRIGRGWSSRDRSSEHYVEIFVMTGAMQVGDAPAREGRAYFFYPPGEDIDGLTTADDVIAYVNFGGAIGLQSAGDSDPAVAGRA